MGAGAPGRRSAVRPEDRRRPDAAAGGHGLLSVLQRQLRRDGRRFDPQSGGGDSSGRGRAVFALVLVIGVHFSRLDIPAGIRWISTFVPARYFIELSRDAFVRGGGWPAVWEAPLMLALIGSFFFFKAWRKTRHMQVEA